MAHYAIGESWRTVIRPEVYAKIQAIMKGDYLTEEMQHDGDDQEEGRDEEGDDDHQERVAHGGSEGQRRRVATQGGDRQGADYNATAGERGSGEDGRHSSEENQETEKAVDYYMRRIGEICREYAAYHMYESRN